MDMNNRVVIAGVEEEVVEDREGIRDDVKNLI